MKSLSSLKDFICTFDDHKVLRIPEHQISMYPKVKVRQQEEDPPEFQRIYVKDFQSPSVYDHPSNSPQHKNGYASPLRVPKSHISTSDAKISSKSSKVDRKIAEENKPKMLKKKVADVTNPNSILPPRAVLSSPENDLMLGIKSKTKANRSSLKNHKVSENTHVKCKKSYENEVAKKSSSWKP